MKHILVVASLVLLFFSGEATAQRFSKEFFTINFLDESIVFMASIDYTTKRHFARDFLLSNVLSFAKVKPNAAPEEAKTTLLTPVATAASST